MPTAERGPLAQNLAPISDEEEPNTPVGLLVVGAKTGIAAMVEEIVRAVPAEFYTCGVAADSGGTQGLLAIAKPRIALIELTLPGGCGLRAAAELRLLHPGLRFILVSTLAGQGIVQCAYASRAGYILVPPLHFKQCLCILRLVAHDLQDRTGPRLSADEWKVLSCFGNGLTSKETASQLGVTTARLRKIDARIRRHFEARNRTEAVTNWLRWRAGWRRPESDNGRFAEPRG